LLFFKVNSIKILRSYFMTIPEIVLLICSVLMLIPTLASLTKFDQWWVRGFDFPRLQICFLIILVLAFSLFYYTFEETWQVVLVSLLFASFVYQAIKIYPYTILAKKQVLKYKGSSQTSHISILVSNVLTTNDNYSKLIARVHKKQPDIVLTLETDKKWEDAISELEEDYPFTVKIPQDNLYGMHLYSKLELEEIEVKYLISDEIPSIHGYTRLRSGEKVHIHCLHPKPPSPTEDSTSTNRDAELLLIGREIKPKEEPVLVFGDLNDVAWSRTTRLFQRISGLLDPRIGRGFYNTYHTGYSFFRWPLDHIFHTEDFCLVEIKRLKSIGSDHFPMYVKLNYEPRKQHLQDEPEEADSEEKEWADEKIEKGEEKEGKSYNS
jgi:endonuclease/exonuclease/phosphatase (EEP) superfamily protein YafD